MQNMTEEQIAAMEAQTKEVLEQMTEGKDVREVLAWIYVNNLEDKTMRQGRVMADAILNSIVSFDSDFREAKEDADRYIDRFIEGVCRDMTCQERCNYLLKLSTAIGSAQCVWLAESEEQKEKLRALLAEVEGSSVTEEEAVPELEAELYGKVKEALLGSGIMFSALIEQEEQLKELENGDEAVNLLLDLGAKETDFRAVMSMLLYVNVKNGTFDNLPFEMTASQAAVLVSAQREQMRILAAVEQGHMGIEAATALLQLLGMIVMLHVFMAAILIMTHACFAIFGWFLAIPASLVAVTGMMHLAGRAMELWEADSRCLVEGAAVVVGILRMGAQCVIGYAKDTVLPELARAAGALMEGIRKLLLRFKKEDTAQENSLELIEAESDAEFETEPDTEQEAGGGQEVFA